MTTHTAATAKAHFSALLDEVEAGGEVVITRRGRVVARLVPVVHRTAPVDWAELEAWVREKPPKVLGPTVEQMRELDLL
jgi:prevent-host-death family protein